MVQQNSGRKTGLRVAVVGATGAVGREMVRMLEERAFPIETLRLMASARSVGRTLPFRGENVPIELLEPAAAHDLDIALFSAGGATSLEYAPVFAEKDIFVIDNSSAWRMDPGVPLVVPEVNPEALERGKRVIANPNCSTIQMVVALKPLHDAARIREIRVATYQSVSGAGQKGIDDLETQARAWAAGKPLPPPAKIPHHILFNLVPQIDVFSDDGYTKEELKMVQETQKILGDGEIAISATCVRVPVFRSHSEAVWIRTERPLSPEQARVLLEAAPGVVVVDDPAQGAYPMPVHAENRGETFVGRIRKDLACDNGLALWVVSDNLLKGAALNAVQIAEKLVASGLV